MMFFQADVFVICCILFLGLAQGLGWMLVIHFAVVRGLIDHRHRIIVRLFFIVNLPVFCDFLQGMTICIPFSICRRFINVLS